jgi:hypothetical protein
MLNYSTGASNPDLIPNGTLARVRMPIRPGGYDEPPNWTGGWATQGPSGAIHLNGEVTVTTGPFTGRKIQHRIIISFKENSPASRAKLTIDGLDDLDGIQFAALIGVEIDSMSGIERNIRPGPPRDVPDVLE